MLVSRLGSVNPKPLQIKPEVMIEKIVYGLALWAVTRMGRKNFGAYLEQARADFLLRVQKKGKRSDDVELWIKNCVLPEPVNFPLHLRKKQKLDFYKLVPQIKHEYFALLIEITRIKKRTRRSPVNLRLSLQERLCGPWVTPTKIKAYCNWKASIIAYDYLAGKYKLGSGDALKKSLALAVGIGDGLSELDKWFHGSEGTSLLSQWLYGSRFPTKKRLEIELVKALIKVSPNFLPSSSPKLAD